MRKAHARASAASAPAQAPAPASPLDLRLAPVLTLAWAGAWALVAAADGVVVLAGLAALAIAGVILLAAQTSRRAASRTSPSSPRPLPPGLLGTAAAGAIVLALVAASVVATGAVTRAGPVPALVGSGDTARLTLLVTGQPRPVSPPERSWSASAPPRWVVRARVVAVARAGGAAVPARTPVVVVGGSGWSSLERGTSVSGLGRLEATERADPVRALVLTRGPPRILSQPDGWAGVVAHLRTGLREACAPLSDDAGGLLPGLVVGDTSALPPSLEEAMRATGLTHLTAVSGANVALVLGAVVALAALVGLGRRVRVVVAGAALLAFAGLAGPDPSVLRAALTGVIGLLGVLSARRGAGLPALGVAATALLVADPWLSRSFGFALSVLATGALLLLARPWALTLERWVPRPLAVALAIPLAAQAVCGPVILLLDDGVPALAVVANAAAAPVVGPSTVVGLAATLLAPVWPLGAAGLAWVAGLGTGWIALVARTAAGTPVTTLPWPGGLRGAVALAAATVLLVGAPPLVAQVVRGGLSGCPGTLGRWRPAALPPHPGPAPVARRGPASWRGSTRPPRRWSSSPARRASSRSGP